MAEVIDAKERAKRMLHIAQSMLSIRRNVLSAGRLQNDLIAQGQLANDVYVAMNPMVQGQNDAMSNIYDAMVAIPFTAQYEFRIGQPATYTSAAIDAASILNGGVKGTLQANDDTGGPFFGLAAGDTVEITNANTSANNGQYLVRYAPQVPGSNVISNGTFTGSATDWTLGANWAYGSNKVTHTAGATNAVSQAYASMSGVADNKPYLCTFTVSGRTAGSLTCQFDTLENSYSASSNGDHQCIVYSDSGGSLTFTPTSAFDGSLDTVTLVPWTGIAFDEGLGLDDAADTKLIIKLVER